MAVNYCGRQLARWLGWSAPAYHIKEGATSHPGTFRHSLQYDGHGLQYDGHGLQYDGHSLQYDGHSLQYDGRFWVVVGKWNSGSLSRKGGDVCELLRKRMIGVCCLQDVRWRGQDVGDEGKEV